MLLADLTSLAPETPISVFGPLVAAGAFIGTVVVLMLRGEAEFEKRVRKWLGSDEGQKALREKFWEFAKNEDFVTFVNAKAEHKAHGAMQAAQLNIDRSIAEGFERLEQTLDRRFRELNEKLEKSDARQRDLEKQFHLFVGGRRREHSDERDE